MRIYLDSETYPIRPGLLVPKLVCLQYAYNDDAPKIILRPNIVDVLLEALESGAEFCAHNGAFDYAAFAAHDERLIQPIFKMLAEGRGRDTMIAEQLKCIKEGAPLDRKGFFSLAAMAERYCNIALDKGHDSWRTRYALLDGVDPLQWPTEALKYAEEDVTALRAVDKAIPYRSPDEWFQVASAFTLQLACAWGMRTDPVTLAWVETSLLTRREIAQRMLEEAGLLVDGSVKKAAVEAAIIRACNKLKKEVPRNAPTEKALAKAKEKGLPLPLGNIKADGETIEDLAVADPVLTQKVEYENANKMLGVYIQPMKWGVDQAMNFKINTLVASGRTSSGGSKVDITNPWWSNAPLKPQVVVQGTNMQNFPQESGVRDCLVPRDGCLFSSTDYSALESRVLAQILLWIVGWSVLAQGYQKDPDFDPHTYFAGHLLKKSYEEAMKLHKSKDKEFGKVRKIAKNINFALPGGVGAKTFRKTAAKGGVELTLDECYFYINEWKEAFPEMVEFFDYITWLSSNGKPYKQFVSRRIRGDVGYCDGCNTGFQGLGADISKYAMFLVSMACYAQPKSVLYRSRPLVLVHDEILCEHPADVAAEANMEVKRLMELAEQEMMPDIPARAEPTLMTRWIKEAKCVWDAHGKVAVDPGCWDIGFDLKRPEWTRIQAMQCP